MIRFPPKCGAHAVVSPFAIVLCLQDILHHAGGTGGMVVDVSVPGFYDIIAIIQHHKPSTPDKAWGTT